MGVSFIMCGELTGGQEKFKTDALEALCRVLNADDINTGIDCVDDDISTSATEIKTPAGLLLSRVPDSKKARHLKAPPTARWQSS